MSKQIVFDSSALDEKNGQLVQIGNKCGECGKTSFPAVELCPACSSGDVNKVPLSKEGIVYSWCATRVPVGPFKPPFIGAYIDLPEGTRLFGHIHADIDRVKTGMKVKVETGVIWTEKDGTEVLGYYYLPSEAEVGGAQ